MPITTSYRTASACRPISRRWRRWPQRYPDDDEAQIGYAITLNVAASPNDKTYANQLKGAAILEPIFKRQPRHPGVAHYLIHLYDYPPIAEKGLDAAKRYAEIAPAAPHAQHMPSHIFTRVGYWKEFDRLQRRLGARRQGRQGVHTTSCMPWTIWSTPIFSSRRTRRRARSSTRWSTVKGFNPDVRAGPYAVAASQARYMIERSDWTGAAALAGAAEPVRLCRRDHAFRPRAGRRALRQSRRRHARISPSSPSCATSCSRPRMPIGRSRSTSSGRSRPPGCCTPRASTTEALEAMSAAADAEDKTEKSIVTPGPLAPARELYGAMLLERGMAKEALVVEEVAEKAVFAVADDLAHRSGVGGENGAAARHGVEERPAQHERDGQVHVQVARPQDVEQRRGGTRPRKRMRLGS